jgi:N-acetylglucosaminyldiphosphoundecaprenol N-acetyl-beta-D-mannosaminyltransferase
MSVKPEFQSVANDKDWIRIMGIRFANLAAENVVHEGLKPGLVVIPSAPVLVHMLKESTHHDALVNARMAVIDSGLMTLLWRIYTGQKLHRVSGLHYLELLLKENDLRRPKTVMWVMPSIPSRDTNLSWLQTQGHPVEVGDCYVAPQYPSSGPLVDDELCNLIKKNHPRHVVLALGGGTQERLGWFLSRQFPGQLTVHCVGAAIGFLSGDQCEIPRWADRAFLGWLFRCCSNPRRFIPRYWKSIRLVSVLWRYRNRISLNLYA